MVSVKEKYVLKIDVSSEEKVFDAKGKTAVSVNNSGYSVSTPDGKTLILTKGNDVITVNNASKLKYFKDNPTDNFVDMFANNLIDYTGEYVVKKNKVSGTKYNDTMDFSDGDKYTAGLTISAGKGKDSITGTKFDDKISGGAGVNEIVLKNTAFGKDSVTLTKGEALTLDMSEYNDLTSADDLNGLFKVSGKNLILTTDKGEITLKGFGKSKTADVYVKLNNGNLVNLNTDKVLSYTDADFVKNDKKKTSTLTGSRFNEDIAVGENDNDYVKIIKAGAGINVVNIDNSVDFGDVVIAEENVKANNIINFSTDINRSYAFVQSGTDLTVMSDTSQVTIKGYYGKAKGKATTTFQINGVEKTLDDLIDITGKSLVSGGKFGTNGNDKITSKKGDEDFYIKKGADTITFGKSFGRDSVNFTPEYDENGNPVNVDTMVFKNYAYSKGSIEVGGDQYLYDILDPDPLEFNYKKGLEIGAGTNDRNGGQVRLENFLDRRSEAVIKDSKGEITRALASHTSLNQNWSVNNENHVAFLYGDKYADDYTIVSNKKINTIITDGGVGLDYTYNGGNDKIYTLSSDSSHKYKGETYLTTTKSDDTYRINSFENNVTNLVISDNGGNDAVIFNTLSDNVRLLFDVSDYEDSGWGEDLYFIHKDKFADTSKMAKDYYDNSDFGKGVIRYSGSSADVPGEPGHHTYDVVETVKTSDHTDGINLLAWKKAITSRVQAWLATQFDDNGNYIDNTYVILHDGTKEQIAQLLSLYDLSYTEATAQAVGAPNSYLDSLNQSVASWVSTDTPAYDGADFIQSDNADVDPMIVFNEG